MCISSLPILFFLNQLPTDFLPLLCNWINNEASLKKLGPTLMMMVESEAQLLNIDSLQPWVDSKEDPIEFILITTLLLWFLPKLSRLLKFHTGATFMLKNPTSLKIKESNSRVNILELISLLMTETLVFSDEYNFLTNSIGKNALRGLSARYPVHAWGMHYRDEVGNISTSRAWRDSSNVNLQITPRFVIFGGWSSNWVISYNLPTNYYLFTKSDDASSFVLKQNFGSPFGNILAEKYTVKVILPEGSEGAKVGFFFLLLRIKLIF